VFSDTSGNTYVRTPYGKALTEIVTTHTVFEEGEMIVVVKDDKVVFNKFYRRYIPNGKDEEERE
jgi:hypothetical protein